MSAPVKLQFPYKTFRITPFSSSSRSIIIKRPIIPVTIIYGQRLVQFEALIDSGADYNAFHGDIVTYLGIKLTAGSRRRIIGIGGQAIKGYHHQMKLKLGTHMFSSAITFSNQIHENSLAVLGNHGFFNHFSVQLDYYANTITLKR